MATSGNIELSYLGYEFFTAIFEKYDRDQDKALSQQELINLFSTCPGKLIKINYDINYIINYFK